MAQSALTLCHVPQAGVVWKRVRLVQVCNTRLLRRSASLERKKALLFLFVGWCPFRISQRCFFAWEFNPAPQSSLTHHQPNPDHWTSRQRGTLFFNPQLVGGINKKLRIERLVLDLLARQGPTVDGRNSAPKKPWTDSFVKPKIIYGCRWFHSAKWVWLKF